MSDSQILARYLEYLKGRIPDAPDFLSTFLKKEIWSGQNEDDYLVMSKLKLSGTNPGDIIEWTAQLDVGNGWVTKTGTAQLSSQMITYLCKTLESEVLERFEDEQEKAEEAARKRAVQKAFHNKFKAPRRKKVVEEESDRGRATFER